MSGLKWVDVANIEGDDKGGRTSWILVSEKTVGSQNLGIGLNETHVGGMVPKHKHETEEEVMYFFQGKGQFITDDEVIELKPGICVFNPPGAFHSIVNTGDEILKFIWIYSPQLASQRIQK
jgi:putative monooxygenase